MTISYKWLKEYVSTTLSPTELDELLTFSGLEVEGVEKIESIKGGLEHVVIAKVLTCEPHPDSDHLHITTVDVGGERPLDIVCGAPNVAAGQKVVCATIGTEIWTSDTEHFTIKRSKIRGAVSEGMLCAADELQLGSSHDGIIVLPEEAPVGMAARDYFHVEDDYTLEVAITANRSDATSHIGVARDVVAVLNTRKQAELALQWPETAKLSVGQQTSPTAIKIHIEEPSLCPRYTGITLRNVTVGESPDWIKNRLRAVGIRPINNIVDVTNYVLMEVGQPLHAFDADKITGGEIHVRRLPQNTPFVTLDGMERTLDARDLMICNKEEGMCIAGVFGGEKSGVTASTRNVFIESAYFSPVSIRKTSQRQTLKTDASYRYERGCDPNITLWALQRAVYLIQQTAGGMPDGDIIDVYPTPIEPAEVNINFNRVASLIGKKIPKDVIRTALTSLNIDILSENDEGMSLRIPTCKVDVYRECDVVEEIMRIYGYNNITFDEHFSSSLSYGSKPNPRKIQNIVSDLLANNGFCEIMNNSLTRSAYYENNPDFDANNTVAILNPLSRELNAMRQTLLYGSLEVAVHNLNHKTLNQKLFEFGRIYRRKPEGFNEELLAATDTANGKRPIAKVTDHYVEEQHVMLLMTGSQIPENWKIKELNSDFYFLKAQVLNIFKRLRIPTERLAQVPTQEHYFEYGLTIEFKDSHKRLASLGCLAKRTLKEADCKQTVFYADICWDLLLRSLPEKEVVYTEVPRFPEVRRDLALLLRKEITFAQIEEIAHTTERKLLKEINLFDVYEGKGIALGMKSYAVSFTLQDKTKTLTDKQIDSVMQRLQKSFEEKLGALIRN
ncbi:MAG: phenylalanine--tRNA ligase subunit beta [Bacteroidales bacterium]|nr:phenylalanine--tRNA ligase subunit beta [Bacteroidales bacterium]